LLLVVVGAAPAAIIAGAERPRAAARAAAASRAQAARAANIDAVREPGCY
jgi:hypothetical protein